MEIVVRVEVQSGSQVGRTAQIVVGDSSRVLLTREVSIGEDVVLGRIPIVEAFATATATGGWTGTTDIVPGRKSIVRLQKGRICSGAVFESPEKPLPGAQIFSVRHAMRIVPVAVSGPDGGFLFADAGGGFWISAFHALHGGTSVRIEAGAPCDNVELLFSGAPTTVRHVAVRGPDGERVSGYIRWNFSGALWTSPFDHSGVELAWPLPPGCTAMVVASGYLERVVGPPPNDESEDVVVLRRSAGVSVSVVDTLKRPIPLARVASFRDYPDGDFIVLEARVTDSDGIGWVPVPKESGHIEVEAAGFESGLVRITPEADNVVVVLRPDVPLDVLIVGPAADSVEMVMVRSQATAEGLARMRGYLVESGRSVLRGLPEGRHTAFAASGTGERLGPDTTVLAAGETRVLALPQAERKALAIEFPVGSVSDGAVLVLDPVPSGEGSRVIAIVRGSRAVVSAISPGTYSVHFAFPDVGPSREVVVDPSAETTVKWDLARGAALLVRGTVEVLDSESGRPVLDARAKLVTGSSASDVGSSQGGRFVFDMPATGSGYLEVTAEAYGRERVKLDSATAGPVIVRLTPRQSATVRWDASRAARVRLDLWSPSLDGYGGEVSGGRASFRLDPRQTYWVTVRGSDAVSAPILIRSGDDVTLPLVSAATVRLDRPTSGAISNVRGSVEYEEYGLVRLLGEDGWRFMPSTQQRMWTSSSLLPSGDVVIGGLPPGRARIRFDWSGGSYDDKLDIATGSEIRCRP